MNNIQVHQNVSLKPYNTFGIDAKAKLMVIFSTLEEAMSILSDQKLKKEQLLILGGGSNLLLTQNFDGLVLHNKLKGVELINENEEFVYLKVGAGEVWHSFVLYTVENGWGGVENLSLIPGTVGAAPMQNIGAYGVEIKESFEYLEALHLPTLEMHQFGNTACKFGYRESIFKNTHKGQYLILSVVFKLRKHPVFNTSYGAIQQTLEEMKVSQLSIKAISDAVIKIRSEKLPNPSEIGNAGSFFKNPVIDQAHFMRLQQQYPEIPSYPLSTEEVKVPAAWLIEKAGWKGKKYNNYGVHARQALVLVNYGGARGSDIKNLATEIQHSVASQFGIYLNPEVNFI